MVLFTLLNLSAGCKWRFKKVQIRQTRTGPRIGKNIGSEQNERIYLQREHSEATGSQKGEGTEFEFNTRAEEVQEG
jgi:hypothetical protein